MSMKMQAAEPVVTVIIPIFNIEDYIERCIDSVIAQTYSSLEIILVNDGSTDRSPQICDGYAKSDSRIRVIHKENGGLSETRNAGLDNAKGDFIFFLDGDDWIMPDAVRTLVERCINDDSELAICGFIDTDGDHDIRENEINEKDEVWHKEDFWLNMYRNFSRGYTVAWNKLYRIEIFQGLRYPVGKIHEDEFLLYDVIDRCSRISAIHGCYCCYFSRPDSIMSASYSEENLDGIEAYLERTERFMGNDRYIYAERTLILALRQFGKAYKFLGKRNLDSNFRFRGLKERCVHLYGLLPESMAKTKAKMLILRICPALLSLQAG